jgi:hypothetical protein
VKYVAFPWSPFHTLMSIINVSCFVKKAIFKEELIQTRRLPSMLDHKLSKTGFLEKIRSVVQ